MSDDEEEEEEDVASQSWTDTNALLRVSVKQKCFQFIPAMPEGG